MRKQDFKLISWTRILSLFEVTLMPCIKFQTIKFNMGFQPFWVVSIERLNRSSWFPCLGKDHILKFSYAHFLGVG
uniref:Uncharacterized protein n=1 Tax=Rhizophora mucronata TaxID=61149 RepID=A0A2P2QT29_RHIMU